MSLEGEKNKAVENVEQTPDEERLEEALRGVKNLDGLADTLEQLDTIPHRDGDLHDTSHLVKKIRTLLYDTHDGSHYKGSVEEILDMFKRTQRQYFTTKGGLRETFDACVENEIETITNEIEAIKQKMEQNDTT